MERVHRLPLLVRAAQEQGAGSPTHGEQGLGPQNLRLPHSSTSVFRFALTAWRIIILFYI